MNWDDAKILLAIGRTGGLSRTAKLLGVSASTVHRRAAELERALNATLFARRQDGYALTDVGHRFFSMAQKAEEHLAAMERQDFQAKQDVFRIAMPELLGKQVIIPELAKLQKAHPQLRLEISASAVPVEFSRHEADIVVRLVRPESGRYLVRRIGQLNYGLFCSTAYLDETKAITTVGDLIDHRLIGWGRDLRYVFLAQWMTDLTNSTRPALSFDDLHAQFLAAKHGHGVALLPSYTAKNSELIQVLPEINRTQDIWIMRHQDTKDSQLADKICQQIEKTVQECTTAWD